MEQNKISRRNFLRVAGASATAAAMAVSYTHLTLPTNSLV